MLANIKDACEYFCRWQRLENVRNDSSEIKRCSIFKQFKIYSGKFDWLSEVYMYINACERNMKTLSVSPEFLDTDAIR